MDGEEVALARVGWGSGGRGLRGGRAGAPGLGSRRAGVNGFLPKGRPWVQSDQ